ncbi:PilN domain-containing protein [Metapseudomonas furukawaii]
MRALDLDFQHNPIASRPGWGLLLAGLSLVAAGVVMQLDLDRRLAEVRADLDRVEQRLQARGLRQAPLSAADEKLRAASQVELRRITAQMNLPWDGLFATLEAQPRKDIALLALTPDARKGQLRITAEARDLAAMLAFHRELEASDALRDVSLLNHETQAEQAEQPIRFNLVATWEVQDARP